MKTPRQTREERRKAPFCGEIDKYHSEALENATEARYAALNNIAR